MYKETFIILSILPKLMISSSTIRSFSTWVAWFLNCSRMMLFEPMSWPTKYEIRRFMKQLPSCCLLLYISSSSSMKYLWTINGKFSNDTIRNSGFWALLGCSKLLMFIANWANYSRSCIWVLGVQNRIYHADGIYSCARYIEMIFCQSSFFFSILMHCTLFPSVNCFK